MGKPTAKKGWCLASEYEEDKLYYVLTIASLCLSDHLSVIATL